MEKLAGKASGRSPDTKKEPKGRKNVPATSGLAVKNGGARLSQLISDKRPLEQKLRDLYLIAFAREPRAEERAALLAEIERRPDD